MNFTRNTGLTAYISGKYKIAGMSGVSPIRTLKVAQVAAMTGSNNYKTSPTGNVGSINYNVNQGGSNVHIGFGNTGFGINTSSKFGPDSWKQLHGQLTDIQSKGLITIPQGVIDAVKNQANPKSWGFKSTMGNIFLDPNARAKAMAEKINEGMRGLNTGGTGNLGGVNTAGTGNVAEGNTGGGDSGEGDTDFWGMLKGHWDSAPTWAKVMGGIGAGSLLYMGLDNMLGDSYGGDYEV